MSYSESNGQVILTMSREDYERVLMVLGTAAGAAGIGRGVLSMKAVFELTNRLNEGNPHYTPYQVEEKK
jgi:hypothetical protein